MMSHYQPVSVDGRTAAAALVREPLPLMMHGSHGSNLQPAMLVSCMHAHSRTAHKKLEKIHVKKKCSLKSF